MTAGTLEVAGRDVLGLRGEQLRLYRRDVVSMVYQNPGSALNPVAAGRTAGRGGLRPPRCKARGGARARGRRAPGGPHRRPGVGAPALPAPALRRDAAAHRDRDGARDRPEPADPRRADHRARRHGRGRGGRPDRRAPGAASHRRAVHQPQPRADPQGLREHRACSTRASSSRKGRPSRSCRTRGTRTRSA